jgi:F-type H+-transporting ATPase subunit alpha
MRPVNGYLDACGNPPPPPGGKFEQGLLGHMRSDGADVLNAIRSEKQLTDPIRASLKNHIDAYAKNFAA